VPRYRLAKDGMALVVDRFDLRPDGTYCGFEDFCVLNAKRSADKYVGSYETAIIRRFEEYGRSSPTNCEEPLHHELVRWKRITLALPLGAQMPTRVSPRSFAGVWFPRQCPTDTPPVGSGSLALM
jgi:hypothetical protein